MLLPFTPMHTRLFVGLVHESNDGSQFFWKDPNILSKPLFQGWRLNAPVYDGVGEVSCSSHLPNVILAEALLLLDFPMGL